MTEDKVREKDGQILEFSDTPDLESGVGQIASFNSLGFTDVKNRPDGWHLSNNVYTLAIILEAKSSETVLKSRILMNF